MLARIKLHMEWKFFNQSASRGLGGYCVYTKYCALNFVVEEVVEPIMIPPPEYMLPQTIPVIEHVLSQGGG